MGRLYDGVRAFLDGEQVRFEPLEGRTVLRFGFRTDRHQWMVVAEVREEQAVVLFASVVPRRVDEGRRGAVADLLARINVGLAVGNFQMDPDDGEVRFRTSIDLEGSELTEPLLRQLLRANLATMAHHFDAIEDVAAGVATAREAMAALRRA